MDVVNLDAAPPFVTKDGSEIRELLAHRNSIIRNQSLAEARLQPGQATEEHYHAKTEEIYYITQGTGRLRVGEEIREVRAGDAIAIPPGHWLETLGGVRIFDIPAEVFIFGGACFIAYLFLRYTKWGRYVYFMGDNLMAARNIGIPVRPMNMLRYVISAVIAFAAGLLTASSLHSMNTRVVNSTLLYDIILVVVIGGIGLSGGKGGMRNVIGGAILIGIMLNAMTIIDIPNIYQNLIKSTVLLIAIIVDSILNPRDEQTAQQGDI